MQGIATLPPSISALLPTEPFVPPDPEPGHLLVVDDQSASRRSVSRLLRSAGYRVSESASGYQALSAVDELQPDLILLDVVMPDISGFEVCHRLKHNDLTRLIPVVMVTALQDQPSLVKGIEVGADEFVSKPFDHVELLARIRSLVYQKHLNDNLDYVTQALFVIAQIVERRDPTTGDNSERLV